MPQAQQLPQDATRGRDPVDGRDATIASTDAGLRLGEAAAIAEIAASLTFDQSMEATIDALAESVVRVSRAVACAVARIDEARGEYRVTGTFGLEDGYGAAVEASFRAGATLSSLEAYQTQAPVIRSRTAYILRDTNQTAVHRLVQDARWDAVVSVPLLYRGQAIGALTCFYPAGESPDEGEIAFLRVIAGQAAVAMETARLFEAVQGKAALEERQKLARELHDSVSQALYGIALGARTARALLDRDPARVSEPLEYVLQLAEAAMAEMRALIFELRPESLEQEGLVAAIGKQADAVRARHQLAIEVRAGREPDLPLATKEALYRIAQEALHNVVKHAGATRVTVLLEARPGELLSMEIADDGDGFDAGASFPGHLGLRSMRERVERVGGRFLIASVPGAGTTVRTEVPLF